MSVRIGYAPTVLPPAGSGREALEQLVEVGETHGYDSLWLSDRVLGGRFPLEPVVALTMVAALSRTMKFGPSVLVLPLRHPVLLAKELATLDVLSNGRLLPAVGLGSDQSEYATLGVPWEDRGAQADEAIEVMRRLWAEPTVQFHGRFFTLDGVGILPRPVQQPGPPIWIGGRTKAAQRRVGRVGDGWLVSQAAPSEVAQGMTVIQDTAREQERTVDVDHVGVMLGFRLAATAELAAQEAAPFLQNQRPDAPLSSYTALGSPSDVVATLRSYIALGATKFVVRPLANAADAVPQLAWLGREVLPKFHHG